jgi:hypothetical protein
MRIPYNEMQPVITRHNNAYQTQLELVGSSKFAQPSGIAPIISPLFGLHNPVVRKEMPEDIYNLAKLQFQQQIES